MADTFPSILTGGLLQRRVMDELGIDEVPDMSSRPRRIPAS